MAEAVILSLIQKLVVIQMLEKYDVYRQYDYNQEINMIINEMREIADIVRDKKFGEGRGLSFLVSDLVHMVHDVVHLYEYDTTYDLCSIVSWIGEIKMRMLKLGDDGAEIESNSENVDGDHVVVGLDKDIEMVLRTMILNTIKYRPWVVIKGMSGIGKTTLAREIYNHPDVVERFKYRAWVCVSNVLTLKEIIIKLLLQVQVVVDGESLYTSSSLEEMDNQNLLNMLHGHLQRLPYLIVLDDLPKQMHLRTIWKALQKQGMYLLSVLMLMMVMCMLVILLR